MRELRLMRVSHLPASCAPGCFMFFVAVAFGSAIVDTFALSVTVFLFNIPAGGLSGGGFPDAGLEHDQPCSS